MKVLFETLYGSQNYGLSGPTSDKDYKIIMLPDFDDLFYNRSPHLPEGKDPEHYSVMDVRKWVSLLKKGNFNAIEYLYSTEYNNCGERVGELFSVLRHIFTNGYLAATWPYFISACIGMSLEANKRGGYTPKTVSRMCWLNEFVHHVVGEDFRIPDWLFGHHNSAAHMIRFAATPLPEEYYKELADKFLKEMQELEDYVKTKLFFTCNKEDFNADWNKVDNIIKLMIKERM